MLTIRHRFSGLVAAFLLLFSGPACAVWAQTNIFIFTSEGPSYAGLTRDDAGAIYGTAGNNVFKLTPPATPNAAWTETILYTFTGGTDGTLPNTTPVIDKAGNLYGSGTIPFGQKGTATVYQLARPTGGNTAWTETILHPFFSQGYFTFSLPSAPRFSGKCLWHGLRLERRDAVGI